MNAELPGYMFIGGSLSHNPLYSNALFYVFIQYAWDGSSYISSGHGYELLNWDVLKDMKFLCILTNSVDTNEMPHSLGI